MTTNKVAVLLSIVSVLFLGAVSGVARSQSRVDREVHLVAIVESKLSTVPARELRAAISTAIGIPIFSLGDIPIQEIDALITISIAFDQEIAVLVQDMRTERRVLSVWPLPAGGDPLARVTDVVAMLIRGDFNNKDATQTPTYTAPMWLNPYYFGKNSPRKEEETQPMSPLINPYLDGPVDFGNRT